MDMMTNSGDYAAHSPDPITPEQWDRIRASLLLVANRLKFGTTEYKAAALARYEVCFDALWEIGCHPVTLARPDRCRLTVKESPDGFLAQWKRPKTGNWCLMPMEAPLARRLQSYIEGRVWLSRKRIWEMMRDCSREAGVPGVTPLTIRHTVAMRLFRALGPGATKESLQVSDRALQHYTSLSAGPRLRAIRDLSKKAAKKRGRSESLEAES